MDGISFIRAQKSRCISVPSVVSDDFPGISRRTVIAVSVRYVTDHMCNLIGGEALRLSGEVQKLGGGRRT